MNFMLSIHGENSIAELIELELKSMNAKVKYNPLCLCTYADKRFPEEEREFLVSHALDDIDVLIYHPDRERTKEKENCWATHKSIIDANPIKMFYVFAVSRPEIKDFLGYRKNIKYLDGEEKTLRDIVDELKKKIR